MTWHCNLGQVQVVKGRERDQDIKPKAVGKANKFDLKAKVKD